ncbi:hypothetical protein J2X46_002726 [Nocardioides sp. BE266]|uniref:hypothetical protein n=1 Tax=Nocardioides sp. BE266 TaxID=2817725 RepID=UPI002862C8B9|nr:hypothetical protein [Nocardioides sp. BE266]MDR7253736.1 hypothetical protein [Nocardioides sp. BE266]
MSGDGLREAVERVRRYLDERERPMPFAPQGFLPIDFLGEITRTGDRLLASDLRRILAEHPATPDSAADDTGAGEREALGLILRDLWGRIHVTRFDDVQPDSLYNGVTRSERIVEAVGREQGVGNVRLPAATPDADDTPPPVEPDTGEVEGLARAREEADFAAIVERVMAAQGWVCDPSDHDDLPGVGECINCDAERHRLGYQIHEAVLASDWLAAHDQQVKAEALREAADEMVGRGGTNPAARFLRTRAEWIARGEAGQ